MDARLGMWIVEGDSRGHFWTRGAIQCKSLRIFLNIMSLFALKNNCTWNEFFSSAAQHQFLQKKKRQFSQTHSGIMLTLVWVLQINFRFFQCLHSSFYFIGQDPRGRGPPGSWRPWVSRCYLRPCTTTAFCSGDRRRQHWNYTWICGQFWCSTAS